MSNTLIRPAEIFIRTILFCIFIISFSGYVISSDNEQSLDEYLSQADYYAQVRWEHGNALSVLREALEQYPDNDEIIWRISRSYADSAEVLQKIEKREEEIIVEFYEKARDYADLAIEKNPENSMAYTRRAIATGQIALYKGIWSAIDLVKQTRDAVEKALELDPDNVVAHFVYARTHAEVSQRPRLIRGALGLGWANKNIGLEHFEKTLELDPEYILYRLDAARVFAREKMYDRARELLEDIPDLQDRHQMDQTHRSDASKLYEEIKDL